MALFTMDLQFAGKHGFFWTQIGGTLSVGGYHGDVWVITETWNGTSWTEKNGLKRQKQKLNGSYS